MQENNFTQTNFPALTFTSLFFHFTKIVLEALGPV